MTIIEKLAKKHGENFMLIDTIQQDCPSYYGLPDSRKCNFKKTENVIEIECIRCWTRKYIGEAND